MYSPFPNKNHPVHHEAYCQLPKLSIPRISYLPLHIPDIYKFFEPFLIDTEQCTPETAWFQFETVPLKWHWPVGLLYDLCTGRDPAANSAPEDEYKLPWTLILHFREFPHKFLMRLDTPNACHDAWMNSVKEADHVRNGNAKAVMSLSKAESTRLWDSLQLRDFDKFWSVNDKLISSASFRTIPIRLHLPSGLRVVQKPISPTQASGETQTVGSALYILLPELFPSQRVCVLARPVLHGVVLAMNTPLLELMREAIYPDGFLHISLSMMS
ncbi:Autophagy protein 5 [Rhizina undulata]